MPYYGLDSKIIVPSNKYKPVQRRTRRSESSNHTIISKLESEFRRQKRDTSEETGFKSALQRLGREVNLKSRLITWPPREVRPALSCLNTVKYNEVTAADYVGATVAVFYAKNLPWPCDNSYNSFGFLILENTNFHTTYIATDNKSIIG